MKYAKFISIVLIISAFATSCKKHRVSPQNRPEQQELTRDTLVIAKDSITKISCLHYPEISYHIYLPSGMEIGKSYPLIIFLDPHARGKLPLTKYRYLADSFGYILAGSDATQNGQDANVSTDIIRKMMNDCSDRFAIDLKRITLAGFSGGARQAGNANLDIQEINSIIACGAGIPFNDKLDRKAFDFIAFAGNTDFNYLELRKLDEVMEGSKVNHLLVEFNGKHDWPPAEIFRDAFYWQEFNAMRKGLIKKNKDMQAAYLNKIVISLSYLDSRKRYLEEYKLATKLYKMINDSHSYGVLMRLASDNGYKQQWENEILLLQAEVNKQQEFMLHLNSFDIRWFLNEANKLYNEMALKRNSNPGAQAMLQRLLNYLSLASNMGANSALKNNDLNLMFDYLTLYEKVDPKNKDMYFLYAIFYGKQQNSGMMYQYLENAVNAGFDDKKRILTDQVFVPYLNEERFQNLLNAIRDNY